MFSVVWVKITDSYCLKYVKAADLLLSVIIILYNTSKALFTGCNFASFRGSLVFLQYIEYFAELFSKLCNLPSELQKGRSFYSVEVFCFVLFLKLGHIRYLQ